MSVKLENLEIIASYTTEYILEKIPNKTRAKTKETFHGHQIIICSPRLYCFKQSVKCCACNDTGNRFILARNKKDSLNESEPFCLHLVSRWTSDDNYGDCRVMTVDHIVPKKNGGMLTKENMQTMCSFCNNIKGSSSISNESILLLKGLFEFCLELKSKGIRVSPLRECVKIVEEFSSLDFTSHSCEVNFVKLTIKRRIEKLKKTMHTRKAKCSS